MNILSILLWFPVMVLRWALILIGLIAVPLSLAGDGRWRTPKMWRLWADAEALPQFQGERGKLFWEMAIRNPTMGLRKLLVQPILEPRPNPDDLVYGGQKSATRWLRHGLYSEFWYLRAVGKKKFEFRIGWKFADGTPGFTPTAQMRLGE